MANQIANLSVEELQRAIAIRQQIEALEAELNSLGSGVVKRGPGRPPLRQLRARFATVVAAQATPSRKKRNMSPEARERIAAAQRARWAKVKGDKK